MQWVQQVDSGSTHSWVLKKNAPLAELTFSTETKTVRLHTNEKRLFFLESAGLLQQRMIMSSEYGVTIGELNSFRQSQNGMVNLNQYKYDYTENSTGISLFDKQNKQAITCDIDQINDLDLFEFSALVFGLAWVLQMAHAEPPLASVNDQIKH